MKGSISLEKTLNNHSRALNAFRLILALLVLYSHSYPLSGRGGDPLVPFTSAKISYGGFAVSTFFALSGLLVTLSAINNSPHKYIWSRILRIYPAFLCLTLVTNFLIGPVFYLKDHQTLNGFFNVDPGGPFSSTLRNIFFPIYMETSLVDIFAHTPFGLERGGSVVNGSLWTLPLEVRCYLICFLIAIFARQFKKIPIFSISFIVVLGALILQLRSNEKISYILPDFIPSTMLGLLVTFLFGSMVAENSKRIQINHFSGIFSIVGLVAALQTGGIFIPLGFGFTCIIFIYLSSLVPARFTLFFSRDLSYATYLWGFPVAQMYCYFNLYENLLVFQIYSAITVLVIAGLSWKFVEDPLLRYKKKIL